jgi:hypothetical protein
MNALPSSSEQVLEHLDDYVSFFLFQETGTYYVPASDTFEVRRSGECNFLIRTWVFDIDLPALHDLQQFFFQDVYVRRAEHFVRHDPFHTYLRMLSNSGNGHRHYVSPFNQACCLFQANVPRNVLEKKLF